MANLIRIGDQSIFLKLIIPKFSILSCFHSQSIYNIKQRSNETWNFEVYQYFSSISGQFQLIKTQSLLCMILKYGENILFFVAIVGCAYFVYSYFLRLLTSKIRQLSYVFRIHMQNFRFQIRCFKRKYKKMKVKISIFIGRCFLYFHESYLRSFQAEKGV